MHRGVAGGVEVDELLRSAVPHAHRHLVALHAGHRVLDVAHLGLAGFGVDEGVVHHHALVHAVEGQLRLLGRPEETAVDAELVAVHALAENHIVTVATLHQIAIHIEVALLQFSTSFLLGVVVLGFAPVLLGLGELELLLAVETVKALVLTTLVVSYSLAVGRKDETHHLALRIQVAVHQLVPLQEFFLSKSGASNKQHR